MITENGAAFHDEAKNGEVDDSKRINYLKKNIEQVLHAKREGVNVTDYLYGHSLIILNGLRGIFYLLFMVS